MRTRWAAEVVAYIDCLLALTVVLLALSILVQPARKADADQSNPPGAMTIELRWPLASDDDVDLWVRAPGGAPVGYSNKTGYGMALLRDDLGPGADPDSLNDEIAQANILRPGEYVVNAHLYRTRTPAPVHVRLMVSIRRENRQVELLRIERDLAVEGEELTLARFTLDGGGNLVAGSVNDLPMLLRSAP
jgi:hypothetical protein